jgi:hypothetical protein
MKSTLGSWASSFKQRRTDSQSPKLFQSITSQVARHSGSTIIIHLFSSKKSEGGQVHAAMGYGVVATRGQCDRICMFPTIFKAQMNGYEYNGQENYEDDRRNAAINYKWHFLSDHL